MVNSANPIGPNALNPQEGLVFISTILDIFKKCFNTEIHYHKPSNEMFLNHIQLLSQRMLHDEIYDNPNDTVMYNNLKKTYTDADNCVEQIVNSIYKKYNYPLSNTEKLYLIVHIQNVLNDRPKND